MNRRFAIIKMREKASACGAAALLMVWVGFSSLAQTTEVDRPFRFGFSMALMPEVNENDSRAAMKVWAETMVKSGAVRADTNVVMSHDLSNLLAGLLDRAVDGVAVSTSEFLTLREQVKFNRFVFGVFDGGISDSYVLLVHKNSGMVRVEELQGRSLMVLQTSRASLAVPWLDTLLIESGLKATSDFFAQVAPEVKLTKAVLPVFFRKADACLVTRKGFKTMGELNPQVSQQLRVLASSPELVPTGFFFREGFPQAQQDKCLKEFTNVHTTPGGQQILTVFQTERLEEHPVAVLESTIALLEKHQRSRGSTNSPQAEPAPVRGGTD